MKSEAVGEVFHNQVIDTVLHSQDQEDNANKLMDILDNEKIIEGAIEYSVSKYDDSVAFDYILLSSKDIYFGLYITPRIITMLIKSIQKESTKDKLQKLLK